MGKIQEAQEILRDLGLPHAQQNEMAALILLSLAGVGEQTPWNAAQRQDLRIHRMIAAVQQLYGKSYAENTRETIRKNVLRQLVRAGVALHNPSDPSLPTNSPLTHYAASDEAVRLLYSYGSDEWHQQLQEFRHQSGSLSETYRRTREQQRVSVLLPDGQQVRLSPGAHNVLEAAIVKEFRSCVAPETEVVYVGDTERKLEESAAERCKELGIPVSQHDKLPDVILYDEGRRVLFLIEAVVSHGPVSSERWLELEEMLSGCGLSRIYVTAFPNFTTFRKYVTNIAWETEVWLAEIPEHLIHFNGDRFLQLGS